ncbi:MAG: hypothetical protein KIT08_08825 [Anaerolineales bacterium]|nr:MAG: hypothetical protein KIT08_08825 [Anaerolineales bacterium]
MTITYYSVRRGGAESRLEDNLLDELQDAFPERKYKQWMGGAFNIGGSFPDIVIVSYRPELTWLQEEVAGAEFILAYLHRVSSARFETIQKRTLIETRHLRLSIDKLIDAKVIRKKKQAYHLDKAWRDILPRIITIEAKISKWRIAVAQAMNNTLFAHYSYVAVPLDLAKRISNESAFNQKGIGLIGVAQGADSCFVKNAVSKYPSLWSYYYSLASTIATNGG